MVELIGIFATILILISMIHNSTTIVGNIRMRIYNIIGSIVYIIYGIFIHSFSTILLNIIVIFIHIVNLYKIYKDGRNNT